MGILPVPIYVSRGHFPLRYEVPKFLARGGHLCMAMLTIAVLRGTAAMVSILVAIQKYFLFTEIHEQCLNQLLAPSCESSICCKGSRPVLLHDT